MTKGEFLAMILDFDDLYAWCYDNGYEHIIENVFTECDMNEFINDDITEYLRWDGWRAVYNNLYDMPDEGCEYYVRIGDGLNDWEPLTEDDFSDYLSRLCDELEDDEFFENETEAEDEDEDDGDVTATREMLFSLLST